MILHHRAFDCRASDLAFGRGEDVERSTSSLPCDLLRAIKVLMGPAVEQSIKGVKVGRVATKGGSLRKLKLLLVREPNLSGQIPNSNQKFEVQSVLPPESVNYLDAADLENR